MNKMKKKMSVKKTTEDMPIEEPDKRPWSFRREARG